MIKFLNKKIILIIIVLALIFSLILFIKNKPDGIIRNPDVVKDTSIANREMVQVQFFWEYEGTKYNDALNILKSEYQKLSSSDIDKMKQDRFDNWLKLITEQSKKVTDEKDF